MANFGISVVPCLKQTGWAPVGYFVCGGRGGEGSPGIFSAASGTTGHVLQWSQTSSGVETANKKKNFIPGERQIENINTNQNNRLRQNAV